MNVEKEKYHPEPYWSEVAERIESREEHNVIAGDDEPYYRYKRQEFLRLLSKLDFNGKNVLELGAGPGGNIEAILEKYTPKSITDADISDAMLRIAQKNITNPIAHFVKTNGTTLPFQASKFDLTYTATVLQHNTDAIMLKQIIAELCRVSSDKIAIFERVEKTLEGDDLCMGRPVEYYAQLFQQHGFKLVETNFININISYWVSGAARKLLNPRTRQEGVPLSGISIFVQKITLPITAILDKIFTAKRDLAMMVFQK